MVTASDLVRQFGTWRERAAQAPVYILHRGRPRLVLTSVALMEALCKPHSDGDGSGDAGDARRLAALLDGSPEMIVIVDRAQAIVAASRSVRARFGDAAAPGAPATGLVAPAAAVLLAQTVERVAASAVAEALELPLAGEPGHKVSLAIEPHPDGVALFGRETGAGLPGRAAEERASFDETFAVSRGAAIARIDRHGSLEGPHTALAALTGLPGERLAGLRFISLFAIQSRPAVIGMIGAVGADGLPRSGAARLLVDQGDPRQVTVSFAPRRRGDSIDGVVALILATN